MTISYVTGIPAAGNNPSTDQPNMQINTNAVNTILAVDHVSFNTAGGGQHNQVTFNSNNTPVVPTSPPVLFTKNDAFSTPQLFYYSGSAAKSSNQYVVSTSGSTFLLGGMILKWGKVTAVAVANQVTVTFPVAFPNACVSATVSTSNSGVFGGVKDGTLATTGFTAFSSSNVNITIFYQAIGY